MNIHENCIGIVIDQMDLKFRIPIDSYLRLFVDNSRIPTISITQHFNLREKLALQMMVDYEGK
jgi:hypothetical protein